MRPYRHPNKRIEHRAGDGRFRRSTLADLGVAAEACPICCGLTSRPIGEPPPEVCGHCGAVFVYERCSWSQKQRPRFLGPEDFRDLRSGAFTECGQPAVAAVIAGHAPRCVGHLPSEEER